MANQKKAKAKEKEEKAAYENEMFNELDRIIKRAKDENEALNNVLKNIAGNQDKSKIQK